MWGGGISDTIYNSRKGRRGAEGRCPRGAGERGWQGAPWAKVDGAPEAEVGNKSTDCLRKRAMNKFRDRTIMYATAVARVRTGNERAVNVGK